ncbi:nucleoside diphosphate kinase 6 isoform X2 [Hirundo rustica]|uniref:nucleoside diphosphate kinase 6 isoform X2 n=1 Tax=Hirundo rustica TaxID=43150 RepID=UPI001A94D42C|nr:nucleoside diphosphate kinase 6 isoform X2 [Hirundo rustica]
MAAPRRLQLTLALLKPDAVAHPLVREAVHAAILRHRFLIVRAKELRCGPEQSRRFYREHAGRFFYQRLVEFMASGPMWAYILAHENAVPLWRSVMGPTKVFRARHSDPDSIRGAYGLTDTRNTTHGSDSPASASREIAFFFPEFDEERWYRSRDLRDITAVPVLSSVQSGSAQDPVCLHTALSAAVPSAVDTLLIFCQLFY